MLPANNSGGFIVDSPETPVEIPDLVRATYPLPVPRTGRYAFFDLETPYLGEPDARTVFSHQDAAAAFQAVEGTTEELDLIFRLDLEEQDVFTVALADGFDGDSWREWTWPPSKIGSIRGLFLGSAVGPNVYDFASSGSDNGVPIEGYLRTTPVAPAGAGGECLFTNIYPSIAFTSPARVNVTPVVDGRILTELTTEVFLIPEEAGAPRQRVRKEIPIWTRHVFGAQERLTAGVRGTWFSVIVTARDAVGLERIEVEGIELEYEVVQETLPGRSNFSGVDFVAPTSMDTRRVYLGAAAGGRVHGFTEALDDDGIAFIPRIETAALAPAGVGGECHFTNIYLTTAHASSIPLTVVVTPILDSRAQTPIAVVLPVTDKVQLSVHELPLSIPLLVGDVERVRLGMRGVFLGVRIEVETALTDGFLGLENPDVEFEVVQETEIAL